jgi:cytosolic carboxypeptidase protein 2/3
MMKGIIDFLVSEHPTARGLRERFVFKIVPMLNPDGVVHGNYRCSLVGHDLNRQWLKPSRELHPEIFNTKAMIARFKEQRDVALFVDLHGHSRKKNVFM